MMPLKDNEVVTDSITHVIIYGYVFQLLDKNQLYTKIQNINKNLSEKHLVTVESVKFSPLLSYTCPNNKYLYLAIWFLYFWHTLIF